METSLIGCSDLCVSRLGFGCWQLGGHGWQNTDQKAIVDAIEGALELGINFFDTADIYGFGQSEELLAQTLALHPLGKEAIVATKFGVRNGENGSYYDNSKGWIMEAVEGSLYRLRRETIDLYQMHWHDAKRSLDDIFADLEKLREQGKIRWYGVSNIPPSAINNAPDGLASFTLKYSLVQRDAEAEILATNKSSFIAWGSLTQGLLSGKYNRNSKFADDDIRSRATSLFAEKNWDYYEPVLTKLQEIAENNNKTMSQVALRFVLDYVPNSIVLAGIKNMHQLSENAGALDWHLSANGVAQLVKISEQKI
ncbi:MAG: aldo/keto reductase [Alphaproteobacteria bacterium]|nr:aldo/keto reductase [Alphaproteobacteria bacterium]